VSIDAPGTAGKDGDGVAAVQGGVGAATASWSADGERTLRDAWLALAVVSTGTFGTFLDLMAANVAFPFIERDFPSTPRSTLAWVTSGYAIAAAALLLVAGRLADGFGRRRVFMAGITLFGVISLGTAAAPNPATLIAARLLQGAAVAMITATAIALILPEFPPNRRGLAIGVWGMTASIGAAAGPTLGALAIEAVGWRPVFLLNVPLAAVTLAFSRRYVAEHRDPAAGKRIDLLGTATGTAAIALTTFAILQGPRWGWASGGVLGAAAAAVVLGALFAERCVRAAAPLVDLALFRHRAFTIANLSQAGTQMAIMVWFFTTPLFLVNVWGYEAIVGGLAVAAAMVVTFVAIPVGRYSDSHGYRRVLVYGGLLATAGMAMWVFGVGEEPNLWSWYAVGLLVFGVGAGMVGIVITNAAMVGLAETSLAGANAVFQTIRRLVGAIGVAVAVALLGDRSTESVDSFRRVWLLIGGGYLFSVLAILAYPERRTSR
jgi:EmrB/QacA subfamily drug resistance transporter